MDLLTPAIRAALRANAAAAIACEGAPDPVPVLRLFNPLGPATWLATELGPDGDTLFGLADLGFGCPELGCFSLSEIGRLRLPFGLGIERDTGFATTLPLSVWADTARRVGSILSAGLVLASREPPHAAPPDAAAGDPLPPADPAGG